MTSASVGGSKRDGPRAVVCGMDFSATAVAALELAVASARGGTVHVVTAYEPPVPPFAEAGALLMQAAELGTALERELVQLVAGYRARGLAMEAHFVSGPPVPAILEAARRTGAELVIVGTHGRTGLARLAMGSIAERVVRLSPVPVLTMPLVHTGGPTTWTSVALVLIATDFSPDSDAAIRAGLALAGRAAVHLVHVLAGTSPLQGDHVAARHVLELALEREAARHVDAHGPITHHLRSGIPEEEILREARDVHADRIVVGTSGKTGLDHLFLGSVAERVVRGSRVPVLVVRRPHEG